MSCEPPAISFILCEGHFRPVLPTIEGNVDYLALRGQLVRANKLREQRKIREQKLRQAA